MSNPSPTCTVANGAGAAQATTNGVDVTAAATITVALSSLAGVTNWALTVVGQDEQVVVPTITINQVAKTATFTAPALPWALILKSVVNNGVNANGVIDASLSTTFKICCLTTNALRLAASNETTENNASTGWTSILNIPIRNGTGAGTSLTIQEEGTPLATACTTMNFVGAICTAAGATGTKTITFTGLFGANPVQCNSVDTSAGVTLTIGGTNASGVSIGKIGTFIDVLGTLEVDQDCTVSGTGGLTLLGAAAPLVLAGANGSIQILNPAGTFYYTIKPGAIVAARSLTLPAVTGSDVFVTEAMTQTLTNKTIDAPAITGNTITWDTASVSPVLSQADRVTNSGAANSLTVHAQNETGTSSFGGSLVLAAGSGTTRYGVIQLTGPVEVGFFTQAMADAPQTVGPIDSICNMFRTTGANTGVRALTLTRLADPGTMVFVRNDCTGSGITVQFGAGAATATIPPNTSALITGGAAGAAFILMTGT